MFNRQTEGSVVCPSCRRLVGVNDETCFNCGRRNPGMWGYAKLFQQLGYDLGFLPFVLYGSILMYVVTLLWDPAGIRPGGMMILSPSAESLLTFGASGTFAVYQMGHWWSVLSASFLHGGVVHIFFNMMWARNLLPVTAEIYGASRSVIIYTVASIVGFSASTYIGGSGLTIGASASIFGLLGALISSGGSIGNQVKVWALVLFLFGFIMPGVDNFAHAGGFVGGYLAGRFLNPVRPASQVELFIAIGCIAAFVASILLSFLSSRLMF